MIRKEGRLDSYAYRVGKYQLDSSVTNVEEGQWVTLKGKKIVVADGTAKKAFLVIGSKREGRDQVGGKAISKVAFLVGAFAGIKVSNYDTLGTYNDMEPLMVTAGGILTPLVGDKPVVAYAVSAPVDGYLEIISA